MRIVTQYLVMVSLCILVILGGISWLFVSDERLTRISMSVNASLLAGLFIGTAFYARQTLRIADETKTLADQTKALAQVATVQRPRDFLPIIDIIFDPDGTDLIKLGLLKDQGKLPEKVTCRLTNIGRGPAFNLAFLAVHSGDQVAPLVQPTFPVGYTMDNVLDPHPSTDGKVHSRLALRVETDSEDCPFIRVTYQDVFGHKWASRKEVLGKAEILGPFHFYSVEEKT